MTLLRIGVDVGGTFTDVVVQDLDGQPQARAKVPSTPAEPTSAIIAGVNAALASVEGSTVADIDALIHGTTVATNAMIVHGWARTGLITTQGFRDVIEIRRQQRPDVYDLRVGKPTPIVPRDLRFEVAERVRADGSVQVPLDEDSLRAALDSLIAAGVTAVAVCFLHSYAHPDHERRAVEIIRERAPQLYVTASSDVAAEFREYPRVSTTIVNASLGPLMQHYLDALTTRTREIGMRVEPRVMQSNGGIASPATTAQRPVRTLVSGPTAGVVGAIDSAGRSGHLDLVTFDVGGTSTDVCLVEDGHPVTTSEKAIAGYPLRGSMVDVHSIGAGGGSIAWVDDGGFVQVGPQSAGATPGPACYGGGGTQPTLTDVNVVLGRLGTSLIGGRMLLDGDAAASAIERHVAGPLGLTVYEAADAVLRVATANMARAIRLVSVERGHDPRRFALVAFGGAGPLHVVDVGREVGFRLAIVPGTPGLLSAYGLLASAIRGDFARTFPFDIAGGQINDLEQAFAMLEREARDWIAQEAPNDSHTVTRSLDLRYIGQSFELTVPLSATPLDDSSREEVARRFYREYERRYGEALQKPIEAVTLRVSARAGDDGARTAASTGAIAAVGGAAEQRERDVYFSGFGLVSTPVCTRDELETSGRRDGPVVIEQDDTTAVVPPDAAIEWDETGNLLVHLEEARESFDGAGLATSVASARPGIH